MIFLRELRVGDETALRRAIAAFADSDPDFEFAFSYESATIHADYVKRLDRERRGIDLPDGWVPHTFMVAIFDDEIVGRVSLRHELNDFLLEVGGHIGFGVVPSFRLRGVGREILRQTLPHAVRLGLEKVLVTCDDSNGGSMRIIESCGGVLEDERSREDEGITRRYWIDLAD